MTWGAAFRLIVVTAGLALMQPALAAPSDDLAAALALPVAGGLVGAADAPRFAWVETVAGVRNVWTGAPGQKARRVTSYAEDDGQELYDLALSADGASLAFVRGGDAEYPDGAIPNTAAATTPPHQQLFVALNGAAPLLVGEGHSPIFSADGNRLAFTHKGEIWLWTRGAPATKLATVTGQVTRLSWSPDGTRLLLVEDRDDHSFVAILDVAGARLRYVDPSLGYSVEPVFSPDGRQLALIRFVEPPASAGAGATDQGGPYWSIRIADVATGETRQLWAPPAGKGGRYAGTRGMNLYWSADGQLVFPWEVSGWIHAYAIDAAEGGTPRELTPGAFELENFQLGADKRSLVYAANAGDLDHRHVWRRPLRAGAAVRVSAGDADETAPTFGGDTLALIATDAVHPAHPVLAGKRPEPLGTVAVAKGFVRPEPVVFQAADGVEVHAQLFRAAGKGRHPALVFVHGGPRRQMLLGFNPMGYYSNAYVLNQHFAAKGYDVLSINYRSGTGYGLAFRDAPDTARDGAAEYRDVLAGGRWLAARDHVDPARIGIWGGSWGGYLTALALARDSALFAAGVDFHGVHSMLKTVENTLSPDAQLAARQLQWSSSPLGAIDRWRSPVLLIHGDDDRNVDFFQSLLLARALSARGIPYRERAFPNERHGFFRYADWLASYRAADAFFDETLMHKAPVAQGAPAK